MLESFLPIREHAYLAITLTAQSGYHFPRRHLELHATDQMQKVGWQAGK